MKKERPFKRKNCSGMKLIHINILVAALLIFSVFGTSQNVNAADQLCQIASDYNQDGDIDGADLQQFAADLESGTVSNDDLIDFAQLFATDDVDSVLAELQPTLAMMVASGMDKLDPVVEAVTSTLPTAVTEVSSIIAVAELVISLIAMEMPTPMPTLLPLSTLIDAVTAPAVAVIVAESVSETVMFPEMSNVLGSMIALVVDVM